MCTALRRGDCCTLLWKDVDLAGRFITNSTSKTDEPLLIPIFPLLEKLLRSLPKSDSPYVFPEQAAMFTNNPDGITLRVQKVFAKAGFFDPSDSATETEMATFKGAITQPREQGVRKASIRGFQSFRVTWVTLALIAGVKMSTIRKITGHRTANIVEKHYYQPGRDAITLELSTKLPSLLGGSPISQAVVLDRSVQAKLAARRTGEPAGIR